jgi:hypothetical protein
MNHLLFLLLLLLTFLHFCLWLRLHHCSRNHDCLWQAAAAAAILI